MNEDEARAILSRDFDEAENAALAQFVALVAAENDRQNLVSAASLADIWVRHILDSTQLVALAPATGLWVDIGTGAGFPGLAVAIVRHEPTWLVEPRRRRAEFLTEAARALGLDHVTVHHAKAEGLTGAAAVVSARAVAPLDALFAMSRGFSTPATRFVFPRGRNASNEVAAFGRRGVFHVKQSLTDPDAGIVVADSMVTR